MSITGRLRTVRTSDVTENGQILSENRPDPGNPDFQISAPIRVHDVLFRADVKLPRPYQSILHDE